MSVCQGLGQLPLSKAALLETGLGVSALEECRLDKPFHVSSLKDSHVRLQ